MVDDPAQARGVPGGVPRLRPARSWPPSTTTDRARLMADAGIVRNGAKIDATIGNAVALPGHGRRGFGSFDAYLARDGPAAAGAAAAGPRGPATIPATTPVSDALSADLQRRGFRFVGSTIVYAFMQSVGLVDDHSAGLLPVPRTGRDRLAVTGPAQGSVIEPPGDPDARPSNAPGATARWSSTRPRERDVVDAIACATCSIVVELAPDPVAAPIALAA